MRWLPFGLAIVCACSRNDLEPQGIGSDIEATCRGTCNLVQTSWASGPSDEVVLTTSVNQFLCTNLLMDTSVALAPVNVVEVAPQGSCALEHFDFDGADPLANWTVDRWSLAPGLDGSGVQNDAIGNDDSASLERTLEGPGWLELWADVSSESGYDFLTVAVDGSQTVRLSGEQRWRTTGIGIPPGTHSLVIAYGKDSSATGGLDRAIVDSLSVLESAPLEPWRSGGCPFVLDSGEGALRAGSCGPTLQKEESPPYPPSAFEIDVFGPTQLAFDWRTSSEATSDFLRFAVDGVMQKEISGAGPEWAHVEHALDGGRHTLRFYYTKDGSGDFGDDTGWIDNLEIDGHCHSGAKLTSQWLDAGAPVAVETVWWEADTPADTGVRVRVRTAPAPSAMQAARWSSCRSVDWGGAADSACAPRARYVQYQIELACEPWADPPAVYGIGIRWR